MSGNTRSATESKVNTFVTATAVIKFSGGSVGSDEWTDSEDEEGVGNGTEENHYQRRNSPNREQIENKRGEETSSTGQQTQNIDKVIANGSAKVNESLESDSLHLKSNGESSLHQRNSIGEEKEHNSHIGNGNGKMKSSFLDNLKRTSTRLSDRVIGNVRKNHRKHNCVQDDDKFETLDWKDKEDRQDNSANPFVVVPSEKREVTVGNDEHRIEDEIHQGEDGSPASHDGEQPSQSFSFETDTDISLPSEDQDLALITNEDLGLSEDHFSQPEGFFGFSKIEELEMAIENCKAAVTASTEHSENRRRLLAKLVQLRLKLMHIKDGDEDEEKEEVKMVLGHRFCQIKEKSLNDTCEVCLKVIWALLQTWYKCTECNFGCHGKCLNLVKRQCVSGKMSKMCFDLRICPEKGLSPQNYRCAECRAPLAFSGVQTEPRLCDYSGLYYCSLCHWNDAEIIPARVIHNWDFEPRKVCRQSKQLLNLMCNKAVLRIQDLNPMLFSFVEELSQIKKLREEILVMKVYFLSCRRAMESKILTQLQSRPHFVENSDVYSLQDLIDIEGTLLAELATIHGDYAVHIRVDCQLCQAKGFICEICNSNEVLFPFDMIATVCAKCSAVYHRDCYYKISSDCPKCARMSQRYTSDRPSTSTARPIRY